MRDAAELANMLTLGVLEADAFPELADEQVAADVRDRLAAVGLELVRADKHYLARTSAPAPAEGFEPMFELNEAELAVAAALYLHLRYLPRHGRVDSPGGRPSVAVNDIDRVFPGYSLQMMNILLGRLKNMRFVS